MVCKKSNCIQHYDWFSKSSRWFLFWKKSPVKHLRWSSRSFIFFTKNVVLDVWLGPEYISNTTQKMKFSFMDFFSKCDHIRSFLKICSNLLKKSVMENSIFSAVKILWKGNIENFPKIFTEQLRGAFRTLSNILDEAIVRIVNG